MHGVNPTSSISYPRSPFALSESYIYMRPFPPGALHVYAVYLRSQPVNRLTFPTFQTPLLPRLPYFCAQSIHSSQRPLRHLPTKPFTLDHFLLRQQTLALYRSVVRSCHRLPDSKARDEMRKYARDEFERQREVMDVRKIRYLLSTGRAEWKRLGGMFGGDLPF